MRTRLCTQQFPAGCVSSRDVLYPMTAGRLDLTLKNGVFLERLSTYVTAPFD